jgi:hypothetical protein
MWKRLPAAIKKSPQANRDSPALKAAGCEQMPLPPPQFPDLVFFSAIVIPVPDYLP